MDKRLYKFAGYSVTPSGTTKARFSNDVVTSVKRLRDNSGIDFVELPFSMTKKDASNFALAIYKDAGAETKDAFLRVINRGVPKTSRRRKAKTS